LKKITLKLLYLQAKYEADDYAVKNEKIDLRGISNRIKNVLLHDQDIIDKRWSECQGCEHLIKATNQCKKCGCFMKVKTKVATARCPIGKWEKEYDFIKGRDVVSPAV
jgi:predicted Zn-ribbon and HTH transcriptional regulator